jgi:hypothetical protein
VTRESLVGVHRTLAAVIAALVLVMAAIAGRSIFGHWDIEVHGYVGNGLFVLAVANMALAIYRRPSTTELTLAGLIGMLTFAQVGLGYVGREELEAAAWHIPNGVLLMALTTYQWAVLQARLTGSAAR